MKAIRTVRQARTADGKRVKVGDVIVPLTHNGSELRPCRILEMRFAGANGVLAKLDSAPDPEYPHHFYHIVSRSRSAAIEGPKK